MEWLGVDRGYAAWQLALLTPRPGSAIWTLTEYWLHRLVFHWEPDNAFGRRMHFIIHGIHHDHPNDKMRLVMPPSVSIPLAALFFFAFWADLRHAAAFPLFAGFILGYLFYDYTHYYVHHFVPKSDSASSCANSTCATTSRTTASATASPRRSGTRLPDVPQQAQPVRSAAHSRRRYQTASDRRCILATNQSVTVSVTVPHSPTE